MSTVRIQVRRGLASEWNSVNPTLAAGELGVETDTRKIKIGTGSTVWTSLPYMAADSPAITEIAQDAIDQALSMGSGLTKSYNDNTNTISLGIDTNVIATNAYVDNAVGGLQNTVTSDYVLISDVGNAGGPAKLDADGNLLIPKSSIIIEGASANDYETTITVTDPTADRTITIPDASGTLALVSDVNTAVANLVDAAPETLNTLNELAAAIGDDANYATTITNALGALTSAGLLHGQATTDVHGVADMTVLQTASQVTQTVGDAISLHTGTSTNVHGIENTADLATKTYAENYTDNELSQHNALTTNVHGIADTTLLATTQYVDDADEILQDNIDLKAPIESPTFTGTVSGITATMVGLGNVDNTSDANKPVSTATQTALDLKADLASPTFTGTATTNHLIVDGDFTVNGTNFAASATSITIEDNMVQLAHQNAANTVDLGLVVAYNDGTAKHSGLVRDVSDAKWKLFKDVTSEPSTTVDFTQGSLDDLKVAALEATTVTPSSGVVFSDGTQTKEGVPSRTPIISKTASYTLSALSERDSLIEVDSSSAVTITIPTNSSVAFPIGTTLDILGINTGLITIAGDTGVTVNATPGLKLRAQWSSCTLLKRGENAWVVYGDLKA